jgi:hypothetical protein
MHFHDHIHPKGSTPQTHVPSTHLMIPPYSRFIAFINNKKKQLIYIFLKLKY